MLRVTISDTPVEQRWILQGQLIEPWVAELRSSWKETRRLRQERRCVVDLSEVTLIDKRGERMLGDMMDSGAQFIACGVYTKHVVENLQHRGKRRCCNFVAWGFALLWLATLPGASAQTSASVASDLRATTKVSRSGDAGRGALQRIKEGHHAS